jgi:hypothetical protein
MSDVTTEGVRPHDAGPADATAEHETSSADACKGPPLTFEGGLPLACNNPDGAACAPQPGSGFVPKFVPPRPALSVCSAAQIATYTENCFSGGDTSVCAAFQDDPDNADCQECMISAPSTSDMVWGPILQIGGLIQLNYGGCVALLDPCQQPCAEALEAVIECEQFACNSACAPPDDLDAATAYELCAKTSQGCSCAPQQTVADGCETQLVGSPAAECFPPSSERFSSTASSFIRLFCAGG